MISIFLKTTGIFVRIFHVLLLRFVLIIICQLTIAGYLSAQIVIDRITYTVDTLLNTHVVAPGIKRTYYDLPEFTAPLGKGLKVNVLEVDVSNPVVSIETCTGKPANWAGLETPVSMMSRKKTEYQNDGRLPVAAINADFYLTSSGGYEYFIEVGRSMGMEISNGMLSQLPVSGREFSIAFDDNSTPYTGNVSYTGEVDINNTPEKYTLSEINYKAAEGKLVFFNTAANKNATPQSHAWSPYKSTMVLLSMHSDRWKVNERIEFKVESITEDTYGLDIPEGKVVLVGNGDAAVFLGKMEINDIIGVKMNIRINNQLLSGNYLNVVGTNQYILQNGTPTNNNWNEYHPRTAIGFSKDAAKVYMVIVDGRAANYSGGVTTRQLADIISSAGAWTAVNLDGGGSTAMVVHDKIANKPSDGSTRAVTNALLAISSLPVDTEIAGIDLFPERVITKTGGSRQLGVITRNVQGEVIDYMTTENITFSIRGNIGSIENGVFQASGERGEGYIFAEYAGEKDSTYVKVRGEVDFSNAGLKNIAVSQGELIPAFDPEIYQYTLALNSFPAKVTVTGEPEDIKAVIAGNITEKLVVSGQKVVLLVQSEDKTQKKSYTITISGTTGNGEMLKNEIKIFPNPVRSGQMLSIHLDELKTDLLIKIYDTSGWLVKTIKSSGQKMEVPVTFSQGTYLVSIFDGGKNILNTKMLVE
ncbi:MAG: phosphodiester glycosidase family protein [Bacteroidales bacterium]|jgi:exopolysaccharide biosynthesis protein|nr:phosphodiester glycosidase family protein [Bacteroidales bacterium]